MCVCGVINAGHFTSWALQGMCVRGGGVFDNILILVFLFIYMFLNLHAASCWVSNDRVEEKEKTIKANKKNRGSWVGLRTPGGSHSQYLF